MHYVVLHVAGEDGSNGVRRGDTEGRFSTFITSLLRESAEQKAGSPNEG